jgi:hypothetical protein
MPGHCHIDLGVVQHTAKAARRLRAWPITAGSLSWIVQCIHTLGEIRDRLKSRTGNEDQLLVIDLSGDAAGWVGVNESGSKWLEASIRG